MIRQLTEYTPDILEIVDFCDAYYVVMKFVGYPVHIFTNEIIYKTLYALESFHSRNVVHRNLRPSHILLDDDMNVSFCGFSKAVTLPK